MAKTTQNDIRIDIIGFLKDFVGMVEKEENVILEPRLLKSLEFIEKEYEKPFDQKNTKKSKQCGKSKRIVEQVETDKTRGLKVQNANNIKKGEHEQQEI